ncbi:MAG: thiamine phosphate synthase [Bauldia sp.]
MANEIDTRCRLCLVMPAGGDVEASAGMLAEALSGGDVASLIIAGNPDDPAGLEAKAEAMVPLAHARGVAALIHNDIRIAQRTGADGVHIDSGPVDLAAAVAALHPNRIAGAAGVKSRHDALLAGEAEPDYVFFGRLDGDGGDRIFAPALELAAWWSSITVIPALVMGARSLASVGEAARAGIPFVALSRAVWGHERGPATAVAEACRHLDAVAEAVT